MSTAKASLHFLKKDRPGSKKDITVSPPDANFYAHLRAAFPTDLGATAVETDVGQCYSWLDLERGSAMLANFLASLSLPQGARVMVQVEKSVEALMLYLATLRAGYVFVPLNTAYQRAEIEYFLGDAEPELVVCSDANFGWVSTLAFQAGTRWVFTLNDDRSGTLLERAAHASDQHVEALNQAGDVAVLIYTSGTTGRSKGAMLTHGSMLSNALVLKDYWHWRSAEEGGDVLIHALPIFHVHGLFVAIHGALINGSKMIWLARFEPKVVLQHLSRATMFMGVPTLYVRLLAEPGLTKALAQHMRLFISGSAPLLLDTFKAWQARTGHTILERYGMSETIMLTSNPYVGERRGGTVGPALPGVGLRVVDAQGVVVGAGEIGDIQVKGPNVFAGYWRMPEKTAEEFTSDGFFKTGDVGKVDADGYVSIVGRSKDLIISGGYNVYPAELESYINELPGVAESAVVGIPHADFGEVGVAVVVPRSGFELDPVSILAMLRANLANYKVPKECHVVADLPRNAMGKVQKNRLRSQYGSAQSR
jgi:malonyl-CoA/methylmalonyl-CoA synthetase